MNDSTHDPTQASGDHDHSQQNGHAAPTPRETAEHLMALRIMPILVHYGTKDPVHSRWQHLRYTREDLPLFDGKVNIGMRLGHVVDNDGTVLSDRFCDIDLDCPEAVRIADLFLPPTDMKWGRRSNPRSHWGYRLRSIAGAKAIRDLTDPLTKAVICELRFSGATGGGLHTLAPGSVNMKDPLHPEVVRWENDGRGAPAEDDYDVLKRAVLRLYAAALLGRHWGEGSRHISALPLAGMLAYGGFSREDALTFVRGVCTAAGEDESTIEHDRLRCVTDTYDRVERGEAITGAPTLGTLGTIDDRVIAAVRKKLDLKRTSTVGSDVGPDGFLLSDLGNAERFEAAYAGRVLYCDDQSQWWVYTGQRWEPDRENRIWRMATELVHRFRLRAADRTQPSLGTSTPDQWDKHARSWQRAASIHAMLTIARALLPVTPEQFDADPDLYNMLNGTVVLDRTTGRHSLKPHAPEDLLTHLADARYDPDATDADITWYFQRFLPEADRQAFFEEACGYSLSGEPKRFNFQLLGPSHAGKSMGLSLLSKSAGDYADALDWKALTPDAHGGGGRPRSDLVKLKGKRVLTITEVNEGTVWDTSLFKVLTSGGDAYAARGAYERRDTRLVFTVAVWTSGNKPYGAEANDDAAYERVRVIEFSHPMPEAERKPVREEQILASEDARTAFMACCFRGFSRLYGEKGGQLLAPESVRQATRAVRDRLDPYAGLFFDPDPERSDEENAAAENDTDAAFVVTGDPDDGVLVQEAWQRAKGFREDAVGRIKRVREAKDEFIASLVRRGVAPKPVQTSRRWDNREWWQGVRWARPVLANDAGGATEPLWQKGAGHVR